MSYFETKHVAQKTKARRSLSMYALQILMLQDSKLIDRHTGSSALGFSQAIHGRLMSGQAARLWTKQSID